MDAFIPNARLKERVGGEERTFWTPAVKSWINLYKHMKRDIYGCNN